MTRIPFEAAPSPFLLEATIRHYFQQMRVLYPDTASVLQRSFYVNDLILDTQSETEALRLYNDASNMMSAAGMRLRKWSFNSKFLRERYTQDGIAYGNMTADNDLT